MQVYGQPDMRAQTCGSGLPNPHSTTPPAKIKKLRKKKVSYDDIHKSMPM